MTRIVLAGGTVATMDSKGTVYESGVVAVEDNQITFVGPFSGFEPVPGDTRIDTTDHLVLPGFVNTHTHTRMTVLRGWADDIAAEVWLSEFEAPDDWLTAEDSQWSASLGCAELLLGGVTTIADRYGPLDANASALVHSGIRAIVTSSLSDSWRDGGRLAAVELIETIGTRRADRVHACIGPHASDTCSAQLLRWAQAEAERSDAQIHMHLAQSGAEVVAARRAGYRSPVELLEAVGLLSERLLVAHAIRLDMSGLEKLASADVAIAHCPTSNVRIEARLPLVREALSLGMRVGIGTDCAGSNNAADMVAEMKATCLLNKLDAHDPEWLDAKRSLRLATIDGARALGLDDLTGSLEEGKRADVIALSTAHPAWVPRHAVASAIVYSGSSRDVRTVLVDGKIVVSEGELTTVDLPRIVARCHEARRKLDDRRPSRDSRV